MIDNFLAILGYTVAIATIALFGMVLGGISPTLVSFSSGIVMLIWYLMGIGILIVFAMYLWAMTFGVWNDTLTTKKGNDDEQVSRF